MMPITAPWSVSGIITNPAITPAMNGTEPGQFSGPAGVAFDSSGYVYVTDSGNQRVQIFSSNGTFLSSFGENGEDDG